MENVASGTDLQTMYVRHQSQLFVSEGRAESLEAEYLLAPSQTKMKSEVSYPYEQEGWMPLMTWVDQVPTDRNGCENACFESYR